MGTGSQRKRYTSRTDQYKTGDWTAYNAPSAASQATPQYSPYSTQPDYLSAPAAGAPGYPTPSGSQRVGAEGSAAGYPARGIDYTGHPIMGPPMPAAPDLGQTGLEGGHGRHAFGADRMRAFQAWLDGLKANRGKPPSEWDKLSAQFEKNYYDPSGDIRSAYGAQESAINAQYDAQLARLGQESGAATAGVRAEGQGLQTALAAIGSDATDQLGKVNKSIDADYAKALRAVNGDYKGLAQDLKSSGVSGTALKAEHVAGVNDLREAQLNDSTLGKRYTQMLGQEINNRKATGATVTVAGVNDIARILQQSRDNTQGDRLQAVAKIEASMAGDLAQAKSAKAQAKYSLFLSTLKSGGTLGNAAQSVASPSVKIAAGRALASGVPNWNEAFGPAISASKDDPTAISKLGEYKTAIATGKMTPDQAVSAWIQSGQDAEHPQVGRGLNDALAYYTYIQGKSANVAAGVAEALGIPQKKKKK